MGRISTGMTEKKRTLLDIDPADRVRLLASATAYAAELFFRDIMASIEQGEDR